MDGSKEMAFKNETAKESDCPACTLSIAPKAEGTVWQAPSLPQTNQIQIFRYFFPILFVSCYPCHRNPTSRAPFHQNPSISLHSPEPSHEFQELATHPESLQKTLNNQKIRNQKDLPSCLLVSKDCQRDIEDLRSSVICLLKSSVAQIEDQ